MASKVKLPKTLSKNEENKPPYEIKEQIGSYTRVVWRDGKWFLADPRLLAVLVDYLKKLVRKKK